MSHEIRTPLNCIVGMSSLLLDEAEDMEPMHADSIQMINTSGELLKAVVDDVLDYAKLESGSFEVDIKETNLQHTLNSVAHSMSEKMREKNVRLRLDYSPFLPEILETDSRRLQQVLFNLLGNAGKFSKNDSVIDLTVSLVPVVSTGVDPSETSNGQVVRFEIKDYGKGIESKDFQTIFEPFSQASKETQTLYGGTGLGLSITSKLVHRLGGTITLKSEYGKFAEFTVNLPMRGKSVDILRLKKRVQDTTIILVEKPTTYDYNLTDHDIKPEPIPFGAGAAEAYNVDVERYTSLEQALDRIKDPKLVTPRKHYAFLVHEDLYQFGLSEKLESVFGGLNYTLMTFGPEFCVEATKDRHFKSLSGVFASSLLEKIAGHIERRKLKSLSASTTVSIGPASTTIDSCETQKEGADELAGRTGKDLAVGSHTPSPGINASAQRCSDTPNDDRTMSDSSKRSPKTSHEAIPSSDLPISCPKQTTNASTGRHHLKVLYAGRFHGAQSTPIVVLFQFHTPQH